MSARITPLRLEAFEHLPKHARRCVFWEVDPATLGGNDHLADPEFEKEAWLSMVMLEWGTCGQVAMEAGWNFQRYLDWLFIGDGPKFQLRHFSLRRVQGQDRA